MAIRIVLTYTRPNTKLAFMPFTDTLIELLNTYIDAGKISDYVMDDSDPFVLKYMLTYKDDEAKKQFRNEPIVLNYADARGIHNKENSIEMEIEEFFL